MPTSWLGFRQFPSPCPSSLSLSFLIPSMSLFSPNHYHLSFSLISFSPPLSENSAQSAGNKAYYSPPTTSRKNFCIWKGADWFWGGRRDPNMWKTSRDCSCKQKCGLFEFLCTTAHMLMFSRSLWYPFLLLQSFLFSLQHHVSIPFLIFLLPALCTLVFILLASSAIWLPARSFPLLVGACRREESS